MTHSTTVGALLSLALLTFVQFKGMTIIKRELQIEVKSKLYFTTTWISTWRWVSCAGFKFLRMSKNGAVQRLILILNSWKTLGCILHPSCLHLTFNNWMKRGNKKFEFLDEQLLLLFSPNVNSEFWDYTLPISFPFLAMPFCHYILYIQILKST